MATHSLPRRHSALSSVFLSEELRTRDIHACEDHPYFENFCAFVVYALTKTKMQLQRFDIKVALLGYVSVGKSTVLNALLQDTFSEVSMRRTTAGINFFRISNNATSKNDGANGALPTNKSWSPETEDTQSPSSTLKEIIGDNKELRKSNTIQEKTFHVQLQQPLCSDMRPDTTLVLVDIPGVNEAGSSKMYMDYVEQKWDTFDCVIVVMDAVQGVNTEEQVKLLEFVKNNTKKIRNIPIIVLGNKVDDPDNVEVAELVDEVRGKVAQIFGVGCRKRALDDVVAAAKKGRPSANFPATESPIFVPVSARNAFLYRSACGLSFEEFRNLDQTIIDKIGRSEVPAFKWKKYSQARKYKVAYEAVSDESEYSARLEMTNFDKFLMVLSYVVGGKETQASIVCAQLDVAQSKLSWKNALTPQIAVIYEKMKALGRSTTGLTDTFVRLFEEREAFAKTGFGRDLDMLELSKAMDQLIDFVEVLNPKINGGSAVGVVEACEKAMIGRMRKLVKYQCDLVLEKFSLWDITKADFNKFGFDGWRQGQQYRSTAKLSWEGLSPHEWKTIASCLLLFSHCDIFTGEFAKQKIELEQLVMKCVSIETTTQYGGFLHCPAMQRLRQCMNTRDRFMCRLVFRLDIPHADPSHWGHVVWKYCDFMKRRA